MVNKKINLGILVIILIFAMMVVGCAKSQSNSSNSRISRGIQLYNPIGTEYTGSGTIQIVNGSLSPNYEYDEYYGDSYTERSTLGKIGEISSDGKLTLEIPEIIPDNFLFSGDDSYKYGFLEISPDISLTSGNISLMLLYTDVDFSWGGLNIKKGWNYMDFKNFQIITNLTEFKWTYGSRGR
jgi:hypothetical protein